jgi:hypothetical protein
LRAEAGSVLGRMRVLQSFDGHTMGIHGEDWSMNGRHALTASDNATMFLWEPPALKKDSPPTDGLNRKNNGR